VANVRGVYQRRPMLRRFLSGLTLTRAIAGITAVAFVFTFAAAFLMKLADPDTFDDFGSALWWSAQTVSTVGYGDDVPKSDAGRALAVVVMLFGVALVPAITSLVVAVFINQQIARMQSGDSDASRRTGPPEP
jgi:voltage-gated potassium channel